MLTLVYGERRAPKLDIYTSWPFHDSHPGSPSRAPSFVADSRGDICAIVSVLQNQHRAGHVSAHCPLGRARITLQEMPSQLGAHGLILLIVRGKEPSQRAIVYFPGSLDRGHIRSHGSRPVHIGLPFIRDPQRFDILCRRRQL